MSSFMSLGHTVKQDLHLVLYTPYKMDAFTCQLGKLYVISFRSYAPARLDNGMTELGNSTFGRGRKQYVGFDQFGSA